MMHTGEFTAPVPQAVRPSSPRLKHTRGDPNTGKQQPSRFLAWFSVGLGAAELLAAGAMTRFIGVPNTARSRMLLRVCGLREIAAGVGILATDGQAPWLWSRVGGDVIDLALLSAGFTSKRAQPARLAAATTAVCGVLALDVRAAMGASGGLDLRALPSRHEPVRESITVNRPVDEVYAFWRNFENFARFMSHVESITALDDKAERSHWRVRGPAGSHIEWDAVITGDTPQRCIAWRSLPNADIAHEGCVCFIPAPTGQATEVHVQFHYAAPGGRLGVAVAKLWGEEPALQVRGDLRRFKQIMETGEVLYSDSSIHRGMHPAQPSNRPSSVESKS